MADNSKMEAWLETIGLGQYAAVFADNDVDLEVAEELSDERHKEVGLSLSHRKKFQKAVMAIRTALAGVAGPSALSTAPARDPNAGAERGQLTVMFCDLSAAQ
jgi:hypothetical protein